MPLNKKISVRWFDDRKGKLTYSMFGSRNGTDGTADCSGSTTQSIKDAGGAPYSYLYSTVTLAPYLAENGYKRISVNQEWDAQEGDIVMMSWGQSMADSSGAGGHVGIMKNAWDFISVDYWTGGQSGTAVSEHNIDNYLNVNQPSYFEVWRLLNKTDYTINNQTTDTQKPKQQEEITMVCTYAVEGSKTIYYFDGSVVKALTHPDQAVALREIYKRNNGKEMPHITYSKKAPFNKRLEEVSKLKAL